MCLDQTKLMNAVNAVNKILLYYTFFADKNGLQNRKTVLQFTKFN